MKSLTEFINETTINEGVWPLPEWFKTMIDEVKPLVYEAFRKNWDEFCKKNEIVNKYPAIKKDFANEDTIDFVYEIFYSIEKGGRAHPWWRFYDDVNSVDKSPITLPSHNEYGYNFKLLDHLCKKVLHITYKNEEKYNDVENLINDFATNYYPLKVSNSKCMIQFKGLPIGKTAKFVYKRLKPIEDME